MRKSTKLLSVLLVVCMLVSLMPVGVLAAEPTGPKTVSTCTLGDPGAAYKLNIVNDAATLMLFEVTVNGKTEKVSFAAGETLSLGINEGDSYKVTKLGNTNYKVLSEAASFQSGEYENAIQKTFSHKLGDGFKIGEEHIYTLRDGTAYDGEAATVNGKAVAAATAVNSPVTITTSASNGKASFPLGGETKTATVNGNYTVNGSDPIRAQNTANTRAANLQTAVNNLFTSEVQALPGYDAATWEIVTTTISASYSNGVLGIGRRVTFSVGSNLMAYQPLTDTIVDIVDPLELGDITLTYTTETEAKAGAVELNVLNGERLGDLNDKFNTELIVSLMGMLTAAQNGGEGSEGSGMSLTSFTDLLTNEDIMGLLSIEALDNMPKGYLVTLTEVNKNDGLYEGLTYTVPMTETMFIHIDMDVMMQEALGSTLFNMAKGQIPEAMLEMDMYLPVSIGQSFALEGVRAGDYVLTITSPGEGWIPAGANTFNVTVTDGGTVSNVGGSHVYGSIRTSTLITPLTQAMGMDLGCLGGLAGLMLGSNSLKMVNTNGVVFNHIWNHIEFTNAALNVSDDGRVTTTGVPGATFTLVDRDRFNALIDSLLSVGKATLDSVIGGIRFDELLGLKQEINEGDGGEIEAEPGMIERVLTSVLALGDKLDGINIPPMLESVADANGLVTFDPQNNVSLQKLIDLIPKLMDAVNGIGNLVGQVGSLIPSGGGSDAPAEGDGGDAGEGGEGGSEPAQPAGTGMLDLGGLDMATVLQLLGAVGDSDQIGALMGMLNAFGGMTSGTGSDTPAEPAEPAEPADPAEPTEPTEPAEPGEPAPDMMEVLMNLLQDFGGGDLGFALLNLVGLSDGRFPTGNYILIQSAVPEGRVRNPMMYVFQNTWNADEQAYHTYASIDLAGVMSNEQFAEFAGRLEQSYVVLEDLFARMATTADGGLSLVRAFIGEGESYNSIALLNHWEEVVTQIMAQIEAARAAAEEPAEPEVPAEPGDDEEPAEPVDEPEVPAAQEFDAKAALAGIIDQVLNTYVPKAAVLSYASNLIYRLGGGMIQSQQEAADLLVGMTMGEDMTFSNFNAKIQKILSDADFVLNGEVTKNWYYYDVNPNIFTNVNIAYHYILNEMLPPELAVVIERALQSGIDQGEALVDQILDQIANGCDPEVDVPAEPDVPAQPDQPDTPDTPAQPDNPGSSGGSFIGGMFDFIGGIIDYWRHH